MGDKAVLIDSATILVIRDSETSGTLEVLMVKRHPDIDFAGGAYVFPGGKVDEADLKLNKGVNFDQSGFEGLVYTAFREVFEESGLILGSANAAEKYRDSLLSDQISLRDVIKNANVDFDLEHIIPFARWITPEFYPKRFDTRFFLAKAPQGQEASPDYQEIVETSWVKPLEFIENFKEKIMFPTLMNLKLLGQASSVEQAFEQARKRKIITIEPKIVNGVRMINTDAGYGDLDQTKMHSGFKSDM